MRRKQFWAAVGVGLLMLSLVAVSLASVEIEYFIGHWRGNQVHLEWRTASEGNITGFNLWRSTEDLPIVNGQINTARATKINATPIPAVHPCSSTNGETYTYTDTPPAAPTMGYYYYIEAYDCSGGATEFYDDGTGRGLHLVPSVYLPFVAR